MNVHIDKLQLFENESADTITWENAYFEISPENHVIVRTKSTKDQIGFVPNGQYCCVYMDDES